MHLDSETERDQRQDESTAGGPAGVILTVDDEEAMRAALADELRAQGHTVHEAASADQAREVFQRELIDLVMLDLRLGADSGLDLLREFKAERPEVAVIMLTAYGAVEAAVEATKLGAYDFVTKPFDFAKLLVEVKNAMQDSALQEEVRYHRRRQRPRFENEVVLGRSPAMREILALVDKVAPSTSTPILILGETGAGKEVIARALHWRSSQSDGPFVDVNCSSIPNELLESELFGHEKGSFTSADRTKKGLFEIAHGGTLFLDEIGEMSMALQAKLLRVLENKRFRRVGGTQDLKVAVRVVAATNKNLSERIREGSFREDLYYRLAVMRLEIPPLRDRMEDLDELVAGLLARLGRELGRRVQGVDEPAMALFRAYGWPGNVRELRNVLERAILLSDDGLIGVESLPSELSQGSEGAGGGEGAERRYKGPVPTMAEAERDAIEVALRYTGHNKTRAAELLRISRQTLRSKVRQYGIEDVPRTRTRGAAERPPAQST
ncbi:MAG: sigma-54 dependent transcriptional regulator [Candidatus Eiseniibacteriota bacterium]